MVDIHHEKATTVAEAIVATHLAIFAADAPTTAKSYRDAHQKLSRSRGMGISSGYRSAQLPTRPGNTHTATGWQVKILVGFGRVIARYLLPCAVCMVACLLSECCLSQKSLTAP